MSDDMFDAFTSVAMVVSSYFDFGGAIPVLPVVVRVDICSHITEKQIQFSIHIDWWWRDTIRFLRWCVLKKYCSLNDKDRRFENRNDNDKRKKTNDCSSIHIDFFLFKLFNRVKWVLRSKCCSSFGFCHVDSLRMI